MTELAWDWQDMVEGHVIQLTNTADQSRTYAYVAMHRHKLYIVEGTVPKGSPEPGLFQQSLGWMDKDGNGIPLREHRLFERRTTAWACIRCRLTSYRRTAALTPLRRRVASGRCQRTMTSRLRLLCGSPQ